MIILSFLVLLSFFYSSVRFLAAPFSFFNVYVLFYSFVVGVGCLLVYLYDLLYGYKMHTDSVLTITMFYLGSYAILLVLSGVFQASSCVAFGDVSKSEELALRALALLSVVSILAYVAANRGGFDSGYESRYESGQGMGFLLIFFPAFIPYMLMRAMTASSARGFWFSIVVGVFVSLLIFYFLNGYRQIFMAILLISGFVLLHRNMIKRKAFFYFSSLFGLFFLLVSMSFIRYSGEDEQTFESAVDAAFYFLQGDLFPVDAAFKVLDYGYFYGYPGWDVFWNHMLRFIPRFLWDDKPEILMNAAGFYTQVVVGYSRNVTLSPTIVGEGLLVGGWASAGLMVVVAGFISILVDKFANRAGAMVSYIVFSFSYMGFFVVREGLESGVYRLIVVALFLFIAISLKLFFNRIAVLSK